MIPSILNVTFEDYQESSNNFRLPTVVHPDKLIAQWIRRIWHKKTPCLSNKVNFSFDYFILLVGPCRCYVAPMWQDWGDCKCRATVGTRWPQVWATEGRVISGPTSRVSADGKLGATSCRLVVALEDLHSSCWTRGHPGVRGLYL